MDLEKKQANLQDKAKEILVSIPEIEKKGASDAEIEAKIEEANRIIAESASLRPQIEKEQRKRNNKVKLQLLIMFLMFATVIGYVISKIVIKSID